MDVPKRTREANLGIEKAVRYLISEVETYCDNEKPLIVHCIRVGFRLDLYGYDKEIVQAALLHDLLEDTKASIKDIESKFGSRVANLVAASTLDKAIADKKERYKLNYESALKVGPDALVIRAADLLDNSFYYSLVNKDIYNYLLGKLSYFLKLSEAKIGKERIYKDLKERLVILQKI